jgi:hypothetical protein
LDLDERKVRSYLWSVPNLCLKAIRLAAVAAVAGEAPLCAPFPPPRMPTLFAYYQNLPFSIIWSRCNVAQNSHPILPLHRLASRERSAGPDRARPAGGAGEPSMCAIVKRGHCSCPSVLGRVRHFTLVASTGLQPILGTRRPPVPCTCARIEFGRAAKGCGGPALRPAGWW